MTAVALIAFADAGSNTSSGALLTLALPIGCVVIMLAIWFLALRSGRRRRG